MRRRIFGSLVAEAADFDPRDVACLLLCEAAFDVTAVGDAVGLVPHELGRSISGIHSSKRSPKVIASARRLVRSA